MPPFPFQEDHEMIREAVKGWLSDWEDGGKTLHRVAKDGHGFDRAAWEGFARNQGMAGISIAEQYGGAGMGLLGRTVIMEETGYTLFSAPFFSTCVLAADIIEAFASEDDKADLLSKIASGDIIISALDGRGKLSLEDNKLNGTISPATDAVHADLILVATQNKDNDIVLTGYSPNTAGLSVTPYASIDPTRSQAKVSFDNVSLSDGQAIGKTDETAFSQTLQIAHGALAAECVGGGQKCLDMTLDYANQRVQFGRQIGSFQSVKHKCADMFIALESARSASYFAASPDLDGNRTAKFEAALIAKNYASEAFFKIAGDAIQMHGGIGFTWEYPLHYFFKRARSNRALFTSSEDGFQMLADQIGLKSNTSAIMGK
ncbi:MAG: acyl-CoA dehydrogenase family protein [Pseudomonadota bacterium]|nr:acyl-CoA dehydrogenase family protein [Pseudomonadota bacterium]